ncbi:MAG: isoform II [Thermoclostridium sp.]|nr:isoform II [Thermoclostridium sp.]
MRVFETLFLVLLLFSVIGFSLGLLKKRNAGLYVVGFVVLAGFLSILFEGYRLQLVPAFFLTIVLLVATLVKEYAPGIKAKKTMKRFGVFLLILFTIPSLLILLLFPVVQLPAPRGSYPVGTTLMSFIDLSREELFTQAADNRNIPVQVWYPASSNTGGKQVARWISSEEAMGLFTKYRNLPDLLGYFSLVNTHSNLDVDVSDAEDKYPVVLFSGGGAMFNGQNVIQMEELASRGYIVFAVGHPYEDFACIYPDGSIVPYSEQQRQALSEDTAKAVEVAKQTVTDTKSGDFHKAILRNAVINNDSLRGWSEDMHFIADKIIEMNDGREKSIFVGKLDVLNMGAFGHSFGGAASGQLCLEDERIKAFINMDGSPFGDAPDREITQPFMILTQGGEGKTLIQTGYCDTEKNFTVVQINGAEHMNFSDLNSLIPAVGKLSGFLGSIRAQRQVNIMNHYILDFFDKHLKGKASTLLDVPSSIYPEVTVYRQ